MLVPRLSLATSFPLLIIEDSALRTAMTDNDLEERPTDFMHALAASDADVANISADRTEEGMVVTFDLLDPDDAELVQHIAEDYDFRRQGETSDKFVLSRES